MQLASEKHQAEEVAVTLSRKLAAAQQEKAEADQRAVKEKRLREDAESLIPKEDPMIKKGGKKFTQPKTSWEWQQREKRDRKNQKEAKRKARRAAEAAAASGANTR